MEKLSIHILDIKKRVTKKIPYVVGEIVINDFFETFNMPLDWWTTEDYQRQWKEGLERIKFHNKSCLVAKIYNLKRHPFIDWWLLYKEGAEIVIRNEVLFQEFYEKAVGSNLFTVETCYQFIPDKKNTVMEDGFKVSEWIVKFE